MHQSREVTKFDLWIICNLEFKLKKRKFNPTMLFLRLIAIWQREEDMASFFECELTAISTSLYGLLFAKNLQGTACKRPKKFSRAVCSQFTCNLHLIEVLLSIKLNWKREEHTKT